MICDSVFCGFYTYVCVCMKTYSHIGAFEQTTVWHYIYTLVYFA